MPTTRLRKVGGSVMLALPPTVLDQLQLKAGSIVGWSMTGGRLVIDPMPRPRYTLEKLLAVSDYSQPQTSAEREWLDAPAIGGEIL